MDTPSSITAPGTCPECGATLPANTNCQAILQLMLALEFQHPEAFAAVHHQDDVKP